MPFIETSWYARKFTSRNPLKFILNCVYVEINRPFSSLQGMVPHAESEHPVPFSNLQQQFNAWFPGLATPLLIFFLIVGGLIALGFAFLILRILWAIISAIFGFGRASRRSYIPVDDTKYGGNAGMQMNYPNNNNWGNNPNNPANIYSPLNPNNPTNVAQRQSQQAMQQAQRAQQQAHRMHQQAHRQANQQWHRHKH